MCYITTLCIPHAKFNRSSCNWVYLSSFRLQSPLGCFPASDAKYIDEQEIFVNWIKCHQGFSLHVWLLFSFLIFSEYSNYLILPYPFIFFFSETTLYINYLSTFLKISSSCLLTPFLSLNFEHFPCLGDSLTPCPTQISGPCKLFSVAFTYEWSILVHVSDFPKTSQTSSIWSGHVPNL